MLHSKSLRGRRHSTNTIGNFQGKKSKFSKNYIYREATFESFIGYPDLDKFWDGIYENDDEAEKDLSSLSFEERILSLHVKNRKAQLVKNVKKIN